MTLRVLVGSQCKGDLGDALARERIAKNDETITSKIIERRHDERAQTTRP